MVYRCHVVERCCLFDCRTCSNKVVSSNRNKLTADFTIDTKTHCHLHIFHIPCTPHGCSAPNLSSIRVSSLPYIPPFRLPSRLYPYALPMVVHLSTSQPLLHDSSPDPLQKHTSRLSTSSLPFHAAFTVCTEAETIH